MSVDTQSVPLIQLHRLRAPHGAHTTAAIEPFGQRERERESMRAMLIDRRAGDGAMCREASAGTELCVYSLTTLRLSFDMSFARARAEWNLPCAAVQG